MMDNFLNPKDQERDLSQIIARGEGADSLLNGETAEAVRAEVKLRVVEAWQDTDAGQVQERERMHAVFLALGEIDKVLRDIINDGHHATAVRDQRRDAVTG